MHKDGYSLDKVPYCFSRSSIKFLGHMGWKISDLNKVLIKLLGWSQLSNPSDLPCLFSCKMIKRHSMQIAPSRAYFRSGPKLKHIDRCGCHLYYQRFCNGYSAPKSINQCLYITMEIGPYSCFHIWNSHEDGAISIVYILLWKYARVNGKLTLHSTEYGAISIVIYTENSVKGCLCIIRYFSFCRYYYGNRPVWIEI